MAPDAVRDALIVATSTYRDPNLTTLRGAIEDASRLTDVLRDPRIGGFDVTPVLNANSVGIREHMEEFFNPSRTTGDLLLLYISCHGKTDLDGHLFFAATDTVCQHLLTTAVAASFVHEVMASCRARRQVIVLDCCYSGAFAEGMTAKGEEEVNIPDQLGRGRVVLTATNSAQRAWETPGAGDRPAASVFTRAFVEGLTTGMADRDGDGEVGIDELYDYIHDRMVREGAQQQPRKWSLGVEGDIRIAWSPAAAAVQRTEMPQPESEALVEQVERPRSFPDGKVAGTIVEPRPEPHRGYCRRCGKPHDGRPKFCSRCGGQLR